MAMTDDDDWSLLMSPTNISIDDLKCLTKGKACNHFPGCWYLGRKDLLWNWLKAKIKKFSEYDFVPKSWVIPADYKEFMQEKEKNDDEALWIIKPVDSSCGKGIYITTNDRFISKKGGFIVSKYI